MHYLKKNNPHTFIYTAFSSGRGIAQFLERSISWAAVVIIALAIISLLSFYIYIEFQPYRGPTKLYFLGFFIVAVISPRVAVFTFIALLPLLPNLHSQLELVLKPAVKYFVAFPAVDATVGLFFGEWLGRCLRAKRLEKPFSIPPWPFALLLIVISISCFIAIARSLWQTASIFQLKDLVFNIFKFKIVSRTSDYYPLGDWLIFSTLLLVLLLLCNFLNDKRNKFEIVFKPLIVGVGLSAIWGVYQSITGFGLGSSTITRPYFYGLGAVGFQPDIHAFGGLMAFGGVGFLGLVYKPISRRWRYITAGICGVCWLALVLSQSRASMAIAVFFTLFLILLVVVSKKFISYPTRTPFIYTGLIALVGFALLLGLTIYYFENKKIIPTYDELNLVSSWRLDLFLGALRMWWQFPLMGVGQGNFLRVSSQYDFSGSALMAMAGGENAHNYFLQLLVEIGLLGFVCVSGIFIWLFVQKRSVRASLIWAAIAALFIGNIYSHSFVVRENLFVLATLVALLYSVTVVRNRERESDHDLPRISRIFGFTGIVLFICCVVVFAMLEVKGSFEKLPFQYASQCYRLATGGQWDKGQVVLEIPEGMFATKIFLRISEEVDADKVVLIKPELFDRLSTGVHIGRITTVNQPDRQFRIDFYLPGNQLIGEKGGLIKLTVNSCLNSKDSEALAANRTVGLRVLDYNFDIHR
jgi:O-antigen ligase